MTPSPSSQRDSTAAAVELTGLAVGSYAKLLASELLPADSALLSALGLRRGCRFRVCRAGDPWILEVRQTRIGLADAVAARLRVRPEPAS